MNDLSPKDAAKRNAALRALDEVRDGMILGLGTGSTVRFVLEELGARVAKGLRVKGIATSLATERLATELGIPLTTFADHLTIDLAIDGADEVNIHDFSLIKGAGGALLREKIVALAAKRFLVVADEAKLVEMLGTKARVPVEIAPFGWETTFARLEAFGARPQLRKGETTPYLTDGGGYLLDCETGRLSEPKTWHERVCLLTGVIDTGIFVEFASEIYVGSEHGARELQKASAA